MDLLNSFYMRYITIILLFVGLAACEVEEVTDPNNPSLASVQAGASKAELQGLVTGLETRQRVYFENATEMFGVFAREVLAYIASDPRFVDDWLGIGANGETYPDFFASDGTYVNPYLGVKQANVLIEAASSTETVTPAEQAGYLGLAKTIKAYQLMFPLLQQYENGIRIDVEDPLNPGPIVGYDEALQAIRDLLDEAVQDLSNAGETFDFTLSSGFNNFDLPDGSNDFTNPNSFLRVNRAIAARAALYAEDWSGVLVALESSFMNLNPGDVQALYVGPAHIYGNDPDVPNPLFYPLNDETNTILIVHPAVVEDTLAGDQRIDFKFFLRDEPVTNADLRNASDEQIPGFYQDNRWASNSDPIPYIRNEELILIYAEANARLGSTAEAVTAINTIRNIWELEDYAGATDEEALIEEILFQRRYSLWAEAGHRWIDLRRTGRLNENYIDLRAGGTIYTQVSRRTSEINWDQSNE